MSSKSMRFTNQSIERHAIENRARDVISHELPNALSVVRNASLLLEGRYSFRRRGADSRTSPSETRESDGLFVQVDGTERHSEGGPPP